MRARADATFRTDDVLSRASSFVIGAVRRRLG
jgi:hypothetical protein